MFDILDRSPSAGSYRCEAMTATEIDAHPDADRIWATIHPMQDAVLESYEDGYAAGSAEMVEAVEEATKEESERCEDAMELWSGVFLDTAKTMSASEIYDALIATDWAEVLK